MVSCGVRALFYGAGNVYNHFGVGATVSFSAFGVIGLNLGTMTLVGAVATYPGVMAC